jgi:hypothetical protein
MWTLRQLLGSWRAAMLVRPQQWAIAAVQQWIWAWHLPLSGAHRVHAVGTRSLKQLGCCSTAQPVLGIGGRQRHTAWRDALGHTTT